MKIEVVRPQPREIVVSKVGNYVFHGKFPPHKRVTGHVIDSRGNVVQGFLRAHGNRPNDFWKFTFFKLRPGDCTLVMWDPANPADKTRVPFTARRRTRIQAARGAAARGAAAALLAGPQVDYPQPNDTFDPQGTACGTCRPGESPATVSGVMIGSNGAGASTPGQTDTQPDSNTEGWWEISFDIGAPFDNNYRFRVTDNQTSDATNVDDVVVQAQGLLASSNGQAAGQQKKKAANRKK